MSPNAITMFKRGLASWGDANLAKILTVREAMVLFTASSWANSVGIIIESDSKNVALWMTHPEKTRWKLQQLIFQMVSLKDKVADWMIQHTPRSFCMLRPVSFIGLFCLYMDFILTSTGFFVRQASGRALGPSFP
ncbi:Uncharacterized protein TCM_002010 [Theobroma cacao]|uniref:RNase H type-1 domain-containing protein n=1 Tax=Theobroma cacao TaxID=3641 RepID=A0A061DKC1_THECC|nr:Uncharacterized protein TCM_002010 [Theobroma cacao]